MLWAQIESLPFAIHALSSQTRPPFLPGFHPQLYKKSPHVTVIILSANAYCLTQSVWLGIYLNPNQLFLERGASGRG